MQHSEKNRSNAFANVDEVKERIMNRFMLEHSLLNECKKSTYANYQLTPLEQGGIITKLIEFGDDHTFFGMADQLYHLYEDIIWQAKFGKDDMVVTWAEHSQTIFELIRFFDWMDHFGPRKKFGEE